MYVTTFYSFKGGVGRTMALVNAAVALAKRGRRVLVVDFDLEAPGLDTFDIFRSPKPVPGVIDFVAEYLLSGQAPRIDLFVSEAAGVGDNGGALWSMPSGAQHAAYAANFNQIDWGALYERHDGYLLFEDLKEQWKQVFRPDYVLIDSRTGHTDTGGICTRQLPDAVAILFFPNDQNLRGLTTVVHDIRSEVEGPRRKEIDLHFVMSNVPDLDDEDSILEEKIDAFREQLGFKGEPMIVHRYDSLSLLSQVVFTKDRPRSRLAREYVALVDEIVRRNLKDRDGALDYVKRLRRGRRRRRLEPDSQLLINQRLEQIEKDYSSDGEVLFNLATLRDDDRDREEAVSLFDRAVEAGYEKPDAYLNRARVRSVRGDIDGANEDARRVLQSADLAWHNVLDAILLAQSNDYREFAESTAVTSLNPYERIQLASGLSSSFGENRDVLVLVVLILLPIVHDDGLSKEERQRAIHPLSLDYIRVGACAEAASLLRGEWPEIDGMNIQNAFNYGMARWGEIRAVESAPFARVVALDQREGESGRPPAPNYSQCLAIAYWAVGDTTAALNCVRRARLVRGSEFSCWRYWQVSAHEFLKDLDEIDALIGGDASQTPLFMRVDAASQGNDQDGDE